MKLKSLQLINFRNYEDLKLIPSETLNLFVGKNAQGKTNLIESIAVSISGSSFRTSKNAEMIELGNKSSNIISEIEKKGRLEKRSIYIDSSGIKHSINGKITTLKDFTKSSAAVIFKPDDLYIIKNSPSDRRRYLDDIISNLDSIYRYNLNSYKKVLYEKNKALKVNNNDTLLDIYDRQLSKFASEILIKRLNIIKILESYAKEYYKALSGCDFKITYLSTINLKKTREELVEEFLNALRSRRHIDKRKLYTSIGPHRDDIDFKINDKSVKSFGSQGEIRSSILVLKLAELKYILNVLNITPVLLLDDVLSELDSTRRDALLTSIEGIQTFITSTNSEIIDSYIDDNSKVFMIENGKYKEIKWRTTGIMELVISKS